MSPCKYRRVEAVARLNIYLSSTTLPISHQNSLSSVTPIDAVLRAINTETGAFGESTSSW